MHRSPFEKSGIDNAVAGGRPPARLAALTEQYRMRGPINEVVSIAFYPESKLVTAPAVARRARRSRAAWACNELIVLDTSSLAPRTARRQGVTSRYNLMHAQLVAALLGPDGDDNLELGLVTPFAPQARLLESLLPKAMLDTWAASTVHRFQGGERDVIVYDTVDTGYGVTPLHRWFTDGHAGSQGARLLNVAASRARDHLVVVAALNRMHKVRARDAVSTFFAHLLDQATRLPWEKSLTFSSSTERITNGVVKRLKRDLDRASTVDIWLPRTPLVGMRELIPHLRLITATGSNAEPVTVWVEPDRDGYLSAEVLATKRAGVNVRPCTPILESLAVVGDVVWSSTRSLLGPDPGVVLRTEHRAFADAVRRAQRRRPGVAPGSGQTADDRGHCRRTLVRFELPRRGDPHITYACASCDSPDRRPN
ncbi:AAA domain-containing protein [Dactylosporangium sucinum]|uniref:DNA2/NAM7 helicase-like C-terminal domain-containing protein n=1 Tax=Dactylosporangium sucinum TaxID=1424081 RepID=A0A917WTH9_9ACTN|nr:C-terminal helicase domain-containing protein [Dactylosporangium sucinum]GGM27887.1 hypothetical protein GCM10007977_031490 [Dactylosporangium sucinum]